MATSLDAQAQLAALLAQCYDALKVYGKEPEQLGNLVKVFVLVLGEYDYPAIRVAFATYLKRHTDLPAPADIVKIIDPPPPVLSAAAYTALRKRIEEGYYPDSEDRAFLRAFEAQEYAKVRP